MFSFIIISCLYIIGSPIAFPGNGGNITANPAPASDVILSQSSMDIDLTFTTSTISNATYLVYFASVLSFYYFF